MSRPKSVSCFLIYSFILLGAPFFLFNAYAQTGDEPPQKDIGLFCSEQAFRRDAVRKVMPGYPEEALRAGAQGVTVLSLYQDGEGDAADIKVLESPHPAIAEAAVKAVKEWKWRKFVVGGLGRRVRSKLTFYFIVEGGKGRVEDPRIIIEEERKWVSK